MNTFKIDSSKEFYSETADHYEKIRSKQYLYNKTVDSIIIDSVKDQIKNILDVGAGNGKRGIYIKEKLNASEILLLEESKEMVKNIKRTAVVDVKVESILDYHSDRKFDLIICLWNVLGHIDDKTNRVIALKKMKSSLSDKGVIFIDFNNRMNVKHYGFKNFIRNSIRTLFTKDSGWFNLELHGIKTKVYVHNFSEMTELIKNAGLNIRFMKSIDYSTGEIHKSRFKGQLLFCLSN